MKTKSILGAIFALLLFANAQAQSPVHYSAADVDSLIAQNGGSSRYLPQIFFDAQFLSVGLTDDGHGNFELDDQAGYGSLAGTDYEAVRAYTGDPVLAAEAAAGLLTPAELARAKGGDPFGYGSWGTLSSFCGAFGFSYTYQGGGGGGYLN